MATSDGPNISSDELVLCLDPTDINSYPGSGTTLFDMAGSNYDASFQGSPTYSDNSIVYNGSTDYLQISDNTTLRGTAEKTFSIWVKFDTLSVATAISLFCKRSSGTDVDYFIFVFTSAGNGITFDYGYDAGGLYRWNTGYAPPINTWLNITFTRNASKREFYLNGEYYSETANIGAVGNSSSSLLIGRNTTTSAYYLNGNTGPIHIWNRFLSAAEILHNFNATRKRYNV